MVDPTSQFLNQGILGAIIVVLGSVVATLFWLLLKEKDRRAEDYKNTIQLVLTSLKDVSTAQSTLQKSVDSVALILDRIRWKK